MDGPRITESAREHGATDDAGIIRAMNARPHDRPGRLADAPPHRHILAHADDLAAEFEVFDPAGPLPLTAEEWRIVEATAAHAAAERALRDAVVAARAADVSWRAIARILGISHQAAHRRYAEWAGEDNPAPDATGPLRALPSTSSRQPSAPRRPPRQPPRRSSGEVFAAAKALKETQVPTD